ncbi:Ltp family lipoprotein [Janibacter cremeus]|uniref:Putative iron-regulated membrane protein n=1 Tax=Janibacter cremeus TaxID=1285192 RepID=A0A852VTQ7_9MICO|nr:Ltp family lipoprotein [Janibacter cremeus]NYF98043.1 putative iron-regulated membrane protein [Janibacter cremeus]
MSQQPPQPPQWQPTNPPVPEVRQSWFARHKVLSLVLGIVFVVVLVCCGAGALGMGGDDSSTSASTESAQAPKTSQSTPESEAATEETPAEEAAEEPQEAPAEDEPEAEPEMTTEQENAVRSAQDYLEFMPFSKQGLVDQLSSSAGDGYPKDVAQFAVEHIESDVDWNEQAVKAAESYLDLMAFSRSGLIEQLTSDAGDGYTKEQAEHAADQVGL